MSPRTVSNRHTRVKAFLRYCGCNTKELPKRPTYHKTMPEIDTDKELNALIDAVTSPRERLLYRLLLQTGMREQEAMYLEWSDIHTETKVLNLQSKVQELGFRLRDFEERGLPLSDELQKRLMVSKCEHAGSSSPIFPKGQKT